MKKVIESNMELLRIVAMFLVLLVHADFFSLGAPSVDDCIQAPMPSAFKVFFQAISIACVDIFVCLSGWFGIRATPRGFLNFIFQCLFWLIGLYAVSVLLGFSAFSIKGIMECFVLTSSNWFIKAYILLYIISPVLNAFVEKASQRDFRNVLLGFFAFEIIYGWLFYISTSHIQGGYSTISFIGLYLLARYIRIYKPTIFQYSKTIYASFLLLSPVVLTFCYITPPILGLESTILGKFWISYISPYCILYAMAMVLFFSKVNIKSKAINWIAASSFAVFLIHANPNILYHFKDFFVLLYNQLDYYIFWPVTFILLLAIFIPATIIDQIRITIWNNLWHKIENKFQ